MAGTTLRCIRTVPVGVVLVIDDDICADAKAGRWRRPVTVWNGCGIRVVTNAPSCRLFTARDAFCSGNYYC